MGDTVLMYTCSFCKDAPPTGGWARNYRWKTKRGFDNHRCYKDELAAEENRKLETERKELLWERWLDLALTEYGIGEKVWYVHKTVTKPAHDHRGRRVRYEEERRYTARQSAIQAIRPPSYFQERELEVAITKNAPFPHFYLVSGQMVDTFYSTEEEAETAAIEAQKSYDEHVELSRALR